MNKKINNQNGLTLVELLATVVLTAIVSILLFSILTKALENTRTISQETVLRDEADVIVSKLIKKLYSTRQDQVIRNNTGTGKDIYTDTNTDSYSYLQVTSDLSKCKKNEIGILINETECNGTLKPIGFKTIGSITKVYIFDEIYEVSKKNINILSTSKIIGEPQETTIYEIDLGLAITHKRGNKENTKEIIFKNKIQPIVKSK